MLICSYNKLVDFIKFIINRKNVQEFSIHFRPWDKDRYMSPDINEATNLLRTEKIWNAVKNYMEQYHAKQVSY